MKTEIEQEVMKALENSTLPAVETGIFQMARLSELGYNKFHMSATADRGAVLVSECGSKSVEIGPDGNLR